MLKRLAVWLQLTGARAQASPISGDDQADAVRALRIYNDGVHPVASLFVSRSGSQDRGTDRLARTLSPGQHVDIILPAALFDVVAVYHDGTEEVLTNVDPRIAEVILSY